MKTWKNLPDRREACTLFVAALEADPQLKEKCKSDGAFARATFVEVGEIEDVPASVRFAVFDEAEFAAEEALFIVIPGSASRDREPQYEVFCTTPRRVPPREA